MHERQQSQTQDRRRSEYTGDPQDEGQSGRYDRSNEGAMTRSPSDLDEGSWNQGGDWTGYVVPYRYYGPGYRGVGYYSVMYQGAGTGGDRERSGRFDAEGRGKGQTWGQGSRSGQGSGWGQGSQWDEGPSWGVQPTRGYAGRGPKGYRRSDDRLREEISDKLMADDSIDASDIEVKVKDGEATLTGTVEDRWSKRHAEDIVERVMGVRDVMNQLRVDESFRSGDQRRGTTDRSGDRSYEEATGSSTGANGKRRTTTANR